MYCIVSYNMDERDLSNNPIHRRYEHGRVYVSDERHRFVEPPHGTNDDDHHE